MYIAKKQRSTLLLKCTKKVSYSKISQSNEHEFSIFHFYVIFSYTFSAIHEFSKALEIDREYQRAVNGQKRAQKLQKMAEKRDYYKILNVKRTASKQEIIKAYRYD